MIHYTVGIAGHIDHGKTTLTKALTGIETDRLKEEKERNISIETGFAHFQLPNGQVVGVVDVPGHERFIRQMIAGSAGIDLVLLLVAADEGIMPQTREHFDILQLLGVKKGIVVISKKELVEDDFLQLVIDEIKTLTVHSFLEYAPIIPVSAKTGDGMIELVREIENALSAVPGKAEMEPFRLPIDRVFTIKGAGTVVTGTIFEGSVQVGDQLRLLPSDKMVRVRGLQVHHTKVDTANAGQRTAMNITGIEHDQIHRGDVLVVPQFLETTQRFDLALQILSSIEVEIKHRARVLVYTGTAEVEGTLLFYGRMKAMPGESIYVQVVVDKPIVLRRGDSILVRRPTPALTLGGGVVIHPYGKKSPYRIETAQRLEMEHKASIRELLIMKIEEKERTVDELIQETTLSWPLIQNVLDDLIHTGDLVSLHPTTGLDQMHLLSTPDHIAEKKRLLTLSLSQFHQSQPVQLGMKRSELKEVYTDWTAGVFDRMMEELQQDGRIVIEGERVRLSSFRAGLPKELQSKAEWILKRLQQENREVSDWLITTREVGLSDKQAEEIRRFYISSGVIIQMNEKWVWLKQVWEETIQMLRSHCQSHVLTINEVKEILGLSRKYIIPILEKMDQEGLTIRQGDLRVWK